MMLLNVAEAHEFDSVYVRPKHHLMYSLHALHEEMLGSYIDEFMYRERHGTSASATFNSVIRDIALRYPL